MARILHDGRPVGVAFLIPDRLLLTCVHVVASTVGLPDSEVLPERLAVSLDFPLLPGRPQAVAYVHFSVPVAVDNSGDVAVLQLGGDLPPGAAPLRIVEAEDLAGHRWRAFGFPKFSGRGGSKDAGIWTRGVVEGREGTGWWQLTCDDDAPFPLAGGFSGAPVWDEEYGGVIGIVVAVEGDQRRRTGYALTVESLSREWPQLHRRLLADSPYRELLAFTEHDRPVFYGRTNETQQLIELLEERRVPILPVFGPSGVGKSSLVGAGLLGHLDSERYVIARLPHGLRLSAEEMLAWALMSVVDAVTTRADWRDRWAALARNLTDASGVRTAVEQTLADCGSRARLVLVIDQFETLLADAPETARRLDEVLGVLTARRTDGSRPAQAVVVTRIDFLQQIEQLPHLRAAWEATSVVVQPMMRAQLRDVITRPLDSHAGVRFADGLVEQMLLDSAPGPSALPMLEYALSRLWERQQRGWLTTTAYQDLGGVEGALTGEAEHSLWDWADQAEQQALERIFIQLVRPGEWLDAADRGPDIRRVAARTQFSTDDWALIHRLASTRLVVVTRRPTGQDTAELAHQALVEKWPRLQRWVEANREFRGWQEGLRRSLRAWEEHGKPRKLVLNGRQITQARRWMASRAGEVPLDEAEFIDASAKVQRRGRLIFAGFAVLTALVLVVAGLTTLDATKNSNEQRALAATRSLTEQSRQYANSDPALAARLALAAQRISPTAEARAQLLSTVSSSRRTTLKGHMAEVNSAAFSPDGKTIATGGDDGTARLWDMEERQQLASLDGGSSQVQTAAFSPDGRTLVTSHDGWKARIWDVRTRKQTAVLTGAGSPAVFSPDGTMIATSSQKGDVLFWDARTHQKTGALQAHPSEEGAWPTLLAFSPDGSTLALSVTGFRTSATEKSAVQLWDVGTKRRTAILEGHTGYVSALAFSPDSKVLATGATDATTRLWDVAKQRWLATLTGHSSTVFALAFSPDGKTLASGGQDRSVRLWDTNERTALVVLNSHIGFVTALAFSPDGATMASGSTDATLRLWDMRTGLPRTTLDGGNGPSSQTVVSRPEYAYSPDGRMLAVGGNSGAVRLHDARTLRTLGKLTGHSGSVSSVRFSPDGRLVAASSHDSPAVILWDTRSHRRLATLKGHSRPVQDVIFSPDGRTLATSSYIDRTTRLWSVRTYEQLRSIAGGANWTSFSPDSRTLMTGSFLSSSVYLWDVRSNRPLATVDAVSKSINSVAWSPDGGTVALTGGDGKVRLWDASRRRITSTLAAHTDIAQSVTFTPDGKTLASSGRDGTVALWDAPTHRRLATLTGHVGVVWSAVFSPDGKTLATVADDRAVRLWDVETHQQLALYVGHTGVVNSAQFSPNGNTLVTSSSDMTVRLWETSVFNDPAALTRKACTIAGRPLTEKEWRRYVPGGVAYARICP